MLSAVYAVVVCLCVCVCVCVFVTLRYWFKTVHVYPKILTPLHIRWPQHGSHFWSARNATVVGLIPWGHSGPLCHALSLLSSMSSWTSMRRRLIKTTASIITKFCRVIETPKYSLLMVQICPNKSKMADGRHLEKSKNHNIFATNWPIMTKFGTLMRLNPRHPNSQ